MLTAFRRSAIGQNDSPQSLKPERRRRFAARRYFRIPWRRSRPKTKDQPQDDTHETLEPSPPPTPPPKPLRLELDSPEKSSSDAWWAPVECKMQQVLEDSLKAKSDDLLPLLSTIGVAGEDAEALAKVLSGIVERRSKSTSMCVFSTEASKKEFACGKLLAATSAVRSASWLSAVSELADLLQEIPSSESQSLRLAARSDISAGDTLKDLRGLAFTDGPDIAMPLPLPLDSLFKRPSPPSPYNSPRFAATFKETIAKRIERHISQAEVVTQGHFSDFRSSSPPNPTTSAQEFTARFHVAPFRKVDNLEKSLKHRCRRRRALLPRRFNFQRWSPSKIGGKTGMESSMQPSEEQEYEPVRWPSYFLGRSVALEDECHVRGGFMQSRHTENSEEVDFNEQAHQRFAVGDVVKVSKSMQSDSKERVDLPTGTVGCVVEVDENSDICIRFDGFEKGEWVFVENLGNLSKEALETHVREPQKRISQKRMCPRRVNAVGEAKAHQRFAVGEFVRVSNSMQSDSKERVDLPKGTVGYVVEVDDNFDICIRFDGFEKGEWVFAENLGNLSKDAEKDEGENLPEALRLIERDMWILKAKVGLFYTDVMRESKAFQAVSNKIGSLCQQLLELDLRGVANLKRAALLRELRTLQQLHDQVSSDLPEKSLRTTAASFESTSLPPAAAISETALQCSVEANDAAKRRNKRAYNAYRATIPPNAPRPS